MESKQKWHNFGTTDKSKVGLPTPSPSPTLSPPIIEPWLEPTDLVKTDGHSDFLFFKVVVCTILILFIFLIVMQCLYNSKEVELAKAKDCTPYTYCFSSSK